MPSMVPRIVLGHTPNLASRFELTSAETSVSVAMPLRLSRLSSDKARRLAVPELLPLPPRPSDTIEAVDEDVHIKGVRNLTNEPDLRGCGHRDMKSASQRQSEEDGSKQATNHLRPFRGWCYASSRARDSALMPAMAASPRLHYRWRGLIHQPSPPPGDQHG